jgi:hypothetical protein
VKQLIIHIPEGKFRFVLDFLRGLGYVKIDAPANEFIISDEQRALVNDELRKIDADPNYLLDWDEVKHQLNVG